MDGWKEKLFRRYLCRICRPARVIKHLQRSMEPRRSTPPAGGSKITAAALQLQIELFRNPLDFVDRMHRGVKDAVGAGAQLAVYPELNNLQLLGMLPGVEKMGEANSGGGQNDIRGKTGISIASVIHYAGPVMEPLVHAAFSTLARNYRLYLMAGSYLLSDGNRVVNRSLIYGPDGSLIGSQEKVHLTPLEKEWGVGRGRSFSLFTTPLGLLAAPVCMDATYFETFRILELAGAEIVMLPIANPEPYNYWLALRGIWPRVQESPVYGIKSALVGRFAGYTFTGKAGIFAPMELTADGSGVLAEVNTSETEAMAVAELDLEALHELRRNHPWRDRNPELYRRYFPSVYRQH